MAGVVITVRPAGAADQPAITALVRAARINPRDLPWRRFVVAEESGRVVGAAQVREHADGAHELASLVVEPSLRGQGIAARLVDALLADQADPVHMLVDVRHADHFRRWGFAPVPASALPRSMARQYRIGRAVTSIGSALTRRSVRIVPLVRPAAS